MTFTALHRDDLVALAKEIRAEWERNCPWPCPDAAAIEAALAEIARLQADVETMKAGVRGELGGGNSLPDFWTAERQLPYVAARLNRVEAALRESVKLQAHYAELLNMHDGGARRIFLTVEAWLKRLEDVR